MFSYLKDPRNGTIKFKEVGHVKVSVQYLPSSIVWQGRDTTSVSTSTYQYFLLHFSESGKEMTSSISREDRLYFLLTGLSSLEGYVHIRTSKGVTLYPVSSNFFRSYGMSGGDDVLIVFIKREMSELDQFVISVDEFGAEIGPIDFLFKKKDLLEIPELKQDKKI